MKRIRVFFLAFLQMLSQIKKDPMLVASCLAPILCGCVFKFGLPKLEVILCRELKLTECISPYYVMFDVFFCFLAPMMFCFASAMVVLMEIDDKIINYYFITPVGKKGYLIGRLVLPALLGMVINFTLFPIFTLSYPSFLVMSSYIIATGIMGGIVCLMIISLSTNKVEGMAITKLSGIIMLGVVVPYFIDHPIQYVIAILPSYWLGRYAIDTNISYYILTVLLSFVWIYGFSSRFQRKII
jgi:fluoroquinolone transport system permease protein